MARLSTRGITGWKRRRGRSSSSIDRPGWKERWIARHCYEISALRALCACRRRRETRFLPGRFNGKDPFRLILEPDAMQRGGAFGEGPFRSP
jgi:hypothetical protein